MLQNIKNSCHKIPVIGTPGYKPIFPSKQKSSQQHVLLGYKSAHDSVYYSYTPDGSFLNAFFISCSCVMQIT